MPIRQWADCRTHETDIRSHVFCLCRLGCVVMRYLVFAVLACSSVCVWAAHEYSSADRIADAPPRCGAEEGAEHQAGMEF
jgi:hypothetical protein